MPIKEKKRNPISPRWHGPHLFLSEEFYKKLGKGDVSKGYEKVERDAIRSWNKRAAKTPNMPRTSQKRGMEWTYNPQLPHNGNPNPDI